VEQFVGLDVSLAETSLCVVDSHGATLWQGRCGSAEAIAATVRARAPKVARIGFESGSPSSWHWHELKKLGLPVICLDARHAKPARSARSGGTASLVGTRRWPSHGHCCGATENQSDRVVDIPRPTLPTPCCGGSR
jgi:hypothetical protein